MTDRRTFPALVGIAVSGVAADRAEAVEATEQDVTPGPPTDLDLAETLLAYVEALYGDRLDEEDLDVVLGRSEWSLDSTAAFQEIGLETGDEPAYGFSAYRDEGL